MRCAWLLLITLCLGCQNTPDELAFGTTEYDIIRLTATANEPISLVAVREGQLVEAGSVLIQQDSYRAQEQLNQASAQLHLAQSVLDELTRGSRKQSIAAALAELNAARSKALVANKQAARAKTLFERHLLSQSELDSLMSERERASDQQTVAQKNVELLQEGSRIEQIAQAQARVDAAASQVNVQRRQLEDLTLKAPVAGRIDDLPYIVGERVNSGALVVSLLAGKQAYARIYVPQNKRATLKIGDSLFLNISGYTASIQGKIRSIADEPAFTPYFALNQKERSRLVYLTEVELADSIEKIPAGLPVQWIAP